MSPLFTIITAVFNAEKTFPHLVESIAKQTFKDFEFIVIDGGSKDSTVDIIKQNESHISKWVSEKDNGIYDAWNKGLKMASGEWIMFLGGDDKLFPSALMDYKLFIDQHLVDKVDYISSRMEIIDLSGRYIRTLGWPWEWPEFLNMMTVAHPGSLHSKKLFNEFGTYDTSYKITGDYELLLRPREKLNALYFDKITVTMMEGGASDSVNAIKEIYRATTETGKQNKFLAVLNAVRIYIKHKGKKLMRAAGINAYLKK